MNSFALRTYRLANCELRRLDDAADAAVLSQALAQMEPWASLGYSAKGLADYLCRQDSALHRYGVVSGGGELSGVIAVRFPWLRGPFLELLVILPSFQRRGFGREVMTWLAHEAASVSKNLWVTVSEFNTAAYTFYQSLGFQETGRLTDLIKEGEVEILLRKGAG